MSGRRCFFCEGCSACSRRAFCVSASSLCYGDRKYFLKIHGAKVKENAAMIKGRKFHEETFKDDRTVEELGLQKFRKAFYSGETMHLKEVRVCSPLVGLHGIVDGLTLRLEGKVCYVSFVELKSGFFRGHIMQVAAYAMMLSDPDCILITEVKKRKVHYETSRLYPKGVVLNVNAEWRVQKKPVFRADWLVNNGGMLNAELLSKAVACKLKRLRRVHEMPKDCLNLIRRCKECNDKCDFINACARAGFVKHEQKYFGRKNLLIATKPKVLNT